jgi:hypothetical protein
VSRKVPPLIPSHVVAKACGYTARDARNLLRRHGLLQANGRRMAVQRSRLRERLPDVFEDVFDYYEMGASESQ